MKMDFQDLEETCNTMEQFGAEGSGEGASPHVNPLSLDPIRSSDNSANQTCDIFNSIGLTYLYQYIVGNIASLQPLWFLTWNDFYNFEYLAHLFMSIFSILTIITIILLYLCYYLLDDNKPVLKPIKELIPEGTFCSPTCTEHHEHRRR